MNPYQINFQTWNKLAALYQERFMDLDLYNDTYDLFCELLPQPNAKILEIGCGPGNITKYLLAKRQDFAIHGLDIAPNMIELAKINNPTATFEVMDCREIDKISSKFDGVMCGFCLPYLSQADCEKLVKDSYSLLSDSGVLYLSAIEGAYEKSGYETNSLGDSMYLYYHEEAQISSCLAAHNFELTHLIRKPYAKANDSVDTHLIWIGRKG